MQVWTNTCCSHPLHGMNPDEVDSPAAVADGSVMGVKHAAVRKLAHELGIPSAQIDVSKMKFLTRLHYWAADTVTHGPDAPWGEHEIDYVLFYTVNSRKALSVQPNPQEIRDIRWVTSEELQIMLEDTNNLFSPWFRLIYQKWLKDLWWKDLDATMNSSRWTDYETIHEFDPPMEHLGGAGRARPLFGPQFDERLVYNNCDTRNAEQAQNWSISHNSNDSSHQAKNRVPMAESRPIRNPSYFNFFTLTKLWLRLPCYTLIHSNPISLLTTSEIRSMRTTWPFATRF
jgi:isopentenyl-diphosphate delta-isomerase type 1